MTPKAVQSVAGAVLGLSVIAWAVSYAETSWVSLPGGFGVLLDSGGLYVSRGVTTLGVYGPGVIYSKQDFVLPLWLTLSLSLAALWGVWRFGLEERRREVEGRCVGCGYDLSGTEGVCPECGGER
ncbi:MAG: hypothetical protein HND58_17380 [Planctomycetota bacterium]|nr:MAG: hypothetical protein HND58_17380 [Planctomycetota bacterium]